MLVPASADSKKSQAWDAAWGGGGLKMGKIDNIPSPMLPFKRGMPLIQYLGLPLKFIDEEATQFADEGRFLKCILLTIGELRVHIIISLLISYSYEIVE